MTTSRNESSHAVIKAYLRNSRGDYKHFFDTICVFWEDQHTEITEAISYQKTIPKTVTNIMFYVDVLPFVHNYALQKINVEKSKLHLKATEKPIYPCTCSFRASMGLPCYYEVWEKQDKPGFLLLFDIDPH